MGALESPKGGKQPVPPTPEKLAGRPDLLRWLGCACGVAYVALLPQFYDMTNAETRFSLKWSWDHFAAILAAVGSLALLYWVAVWGVALLLQRRPFTPARQVVRHALAWIVFCIFIRCVVSIADRSGVLPVFLMPEGVLGGRAGKLVLYLLIPAMLWLASRRKFLLIARRLCLLAFILFGVFCAMALTYPRYSVDIEPAPLPPVSGRLARTVPSVFILFFDEWAYDRTYPEGVLRKDLPHLSALAEVSTTYHRNYSAGPTTLTSVPRFLLQRNPTYATQDFNQMVGQLRSNRPLEGPSLFAGHTNHFRAAFGMYHTHRLLVGADAEYCASIPFMDMAASVPQRTLDLLFTQVAWLRHLGIPVNRLIDPKRGGGPECLRKLVPLWLELAARTAQEPVFVFCHLPIPHAPFVWDSAGPISRVDFRSDVEGYLGNLRYMDSLLGEFVDVLQEAGTFDQTLLIVTTDHAWRFDPDKRKFDAVAEDARPESEFKHVPLLVKRPYQRSPGRVDEPFFSAQLYPLIEEALRTPAVSPPERNAAN